VSNIIYLSLNRAHLSEAGPRTSTPKRIGTSSPSRALEPMEDRSRSVVASFLVDPVVSMGLFAFEERSKITMTGISLDGVEKKCLGT